MTDCKFCRTTPNAGEVACSSFDQADKCAWFDEADRRAYSRRSSADTHCAGRPVRRSTTVTALERLRLMFPEGNDVTATNGNGSGISGLFPALTRGWVEVVGKFGKPTTWRITEAGRAVLTEQQRQGDE